MTTIAANRYGMAADSMATDEDGTRSCVPKIFQVRGDIIGVAGDYYHARQFVDWYKDRRKRRPEYDSDSDFEAMVLTGKGELIVWTSRMVPVPLTNDCWAIGSGRQAALAVMHMGEPPQVAIEIASKIDSATDGPINIMNLDNK